MKIKLILFSSELHSKSNLLEARGHLFDGLRAFSDLSIIDATNYTSIIETSSETEDNDSITVLFIASGGTEEMFLNLLPFIKQPIVIISDGYHNSFAAAFEICTWLENNNFEHSLFNCPMDMGDDDFENLKKHLTQIHNDIIIKHKLSETKIGLIGGSSSWLIASHIDKTEVSSKYGIIFIDVKIAELVELYKQFKENTKDIESDPLYLRYINHLIEDRTPEHLKDALYLYYALKEICSKYSLSAITIRCFDLLDICSVTACLALAILNDEGIVAGCEGDIPTLFTMLTIKIYNGNCGFVANPSSADFKNYTLDLSHCSIPISMTNSFKLPSHFESHKGIGIQGDVTLGEYSLVKIAGKNLDKAYSCVGTLIECKRIEQRCRTQVKFKFKSKEDFDNFLSNRLSNHVVITKGKIKL